MFHTSEANSYNRKPLYKGFRKQKRLAYKLLYTIIIEMVKYYKIPRSNATKPKYSNLSKIVLSTFFLVFVLSSTFVKAQALHSLPACTAAETATFLVWNTTTGGGATAWTPAGATSFSAPNIQGGGNSINFSLTGATSFMSALGGTPTPMVSSFLAPIPVLSFFASPSYGPNDSVVLTLDFVPPVSQNLAFDLYHVNKSGGGGDKIRVSASYAGGTPFYPTLTSPLAWPSWVNTAPGEVDAFNASIYKDRGQVGINFTGTGYIDQVKIVWKECGNCNSNTHGFGIGGFDFAL